MVLLAQATPFAVRARRIAVLALPALALVAGLSGCGHRRSAMRPTYGRAIQATPVLTAPEAGCATGPVMTTTPAASEPFAAPTFGAPSAAAPATDGVIRAGGGSPPPADAEVIPEQPTLTAPNALRVNPTSSTVIRGAATTRPGSARGAGRQASTSTRAARAALRDRVKPYVESPEDLFAPPKADRPWQYVVLHHSATAEGGLDQVDRDHRKILGFEGCGYHFVIGNGTDSPDGQIEVADRWLNQRNGVHCRNGKTPEVNEYGVGICLVGNFDQAEPTPKQVAAAKALVAYLADRYNIPADHLGAHDQFASGPTACPGKNFPAASILGTDHVARR